MVRNTVSVVVLKALRGQNLSRFLTCHGQFCNLINVHEKRVFLHALLLFAILGLFDLVQLYHLGLQLHCSSMVEMLCVRGSLTIVSFLFLE